MSRGDSAEREEAFLEHLQHRAFFFALQIVYETHGIDPLHEKTWRRLEEIAQGETTVAPTPSDFQTADPELSEALEENLGEAIASDRLMATAILRNKKRLLDL